MRRTNSAELRLPRLPRGPNLPPRGLRMEPIPENRRWLLNAFCLPTPSCRRFPSSSSSSSRSSSMSKSSGKGCRKERTQAPPPLILRYQCESLKVEMEDRWLEIASSDSSSSSSSTCESKLLSSFSSCSWSRDLWKASGDLSTRWQNYFGE